MASTQDRRGPNQHYATPSLSRWHESSSEQLSAYWASNGGYSEPEDTRARNQVAAGLQPTDDRPKKKKPASLRSLIRRRPSEKEQPPHVRSQSLSPGYQAEPLGSAPASVTTFDQASQRSISQPPMLSRALSANNGDGSLHYPSISRSAASNDSRQAYGDTYLGPRPSQTYPQASWDQSSRSHSYYEPDRAWDAPYGQHTQDRAQTPKPMQASSQARQTGTDDDEPTDFHLFVEATSGLDSSASFLLTSPQSPPNPRPTFQLSRQQPPGLHTNPQSNAHYLQEPPPQATVMTQENYTPSQAFNESIQNISGDEEQPPDDELPDYAQSQAEASQKRRREAAIRAAELERRWQAATRSSR
jgi:hypothetical protein